MDPPEQLIELMDEAGIESAVIMTYADVPGLDMDAVNLPHLHFQFRGRGFQEND